MKQDKTVERLRTFFRASNAAFNMQKEIEKAFSGNKFAQEHPMAALHRLALNEIEKDSPNIGMMAKLLELMEAEAESKLRHGDNPSF